jgi:outer membrane protein TolC
MLMTTLVTALSLLLADGPPAKAPAAEGWQLTLRDAIRIGLENSEIIRIVPDPARKDATTAVATNAPIVIARLNADATVWNFKAAVMAHLRSIEQQYWALSQQQVQVSAREQAVKLNEEIVRRERAELLELSRGTTADVAEAQQNLESAQITLNAAKADLVTTERQLRNILGLRGEDKRRIIPITAPIEAPVEPDWDSCFAQMLVEQPDIVQQKLLVRASELQLLLARNQLLPQLNLQALYQLNGLGSHLDNALATGDQPKGSDPRIANLAQSAGSNGNPGNSKNVDQWQVSLTYAVPIGCRAPLANTRAAQYQVLRQRAFLEQVVQQTTHSLARFFLEVDSNYKLFKTASRLRQAAQVRLEKAQAYYEEGRTGFTIDRLLDAVNQHTNAIANEAQYKTSYNTSIVSLEEARGTLLSDDNIVVLESCTRQSQTEERGLQVAKERVIPEWPAILFRAERCMCCIDSAERLRYAISDGLKPILASLYDPPACVLSQPVPAPKTAPWSESLPGAFGLVMPPAYSSYLKPIPVSLYGPPDPVEPQHAPAEEPKTYHLSLNDAIRIGVENSKALHIRYEVWTHHSEAARSRVLRVFPADKDASLSDVRSALLAHVRSVEQQYWAIAQERATVEAWESAVKACEKLVREEKENLGTGRGGTADLAEATQSLERCQLAYATASADLLTMERQLRNLLGLPATDGRRIDTISSPRKDKVEPVRDDCLAVMFANRPETAEQPAIEKEAQRLKQFIDSVRSYYDQAVTATKLHEAARDRLKSANAFYNEGRTGFTIDRMLDAIRLNAEAAIQEANCWASYNTALAALAESKGTLLTEKRIAVVRAPRDEPASKDKAVVAAVAEGKAPAAKPLTFDLDLLPAPAPALIKSLTNGVLGVDVDLNVRPTWHVPQAAADTKPVQASAPTPRPEGSMTMPAPPPGAKTIRYGIQIDGWAQPLQIQGSISIGPEAKKER